MAEFWFSSFEERFSSPFLPSFKASHISVFDFPSLCADCENQSLFGYGIFVGECDLWCLWLPEAALLSLASRLDGQWVPAVAVGNTGSVWAQQTSGFAVLPQWGFSQWERGCPECAINSLTGCGVVSELVSLLDGQSVSQGFDGCHALAVTPCWWWREEKRSAFSAVSHLAANCRNAERDVSCAVKHIFIMLSLLLDGPVMQVVFYESINTWKFLLHTVCRLNCFIYFYTLFWSSSYLSTRFIFIYLLMSLNESNSR